MDRNNRILKPASSLYRLKYIVLQFYSLTQISTTANENYAGPLWLDIDLF